MQADKLNITAIPAFDDNYIWLLTAGGTTVRWLTPATRTRYLRFWSRRA